ncbi:transaldolase [Helicobacter acinonychis]|uniref:Transaldolase n=1 Tax=Helicobacter acinonychis (strain Sheeba) TaxID=382638 RepID=Q17V75_HELAH|nr:transaldolase [Helicobacter acinonychis]CAK00451.1 tal [Helicobacter acinonychis str. Sheeba]STP05034.1 transaldolase [Helicobacter acinonychis]
MQEFSLWCDFIEKDFLENDFLKLINKGAICGATSNPSLFCEAITKSAFYKDEIAKLKGKKAKEIYETLALKDILQASNALMPLHEKDPKNGYISLEIDPFLEDDAAKSIDEAKRLFKILNRPNVMIKVPASESGLEAVSALAKASIPINATLVFSPKIAGEIAQILAKDAQKRAVISVFVSRFDKEIDPLVVQNLQAKSGIINAIECYHTINEHASKFTSTLFASTGVKSNALAKDYYIKALCFKNSINTAPLDALNAYLLNLNTEYQTPLKSAEIEAFKKELQTQNIDLENTAQKLLKEGLIAFKQSFEKLLKSF